MYEAVMMKTFTAHCLSKIYVQITNIEQVCYFLFKEADTIDLSERRLRFIKF